jgi:SAM-dependent methyltransferase
MWAWKDLIPRYVQSSFLDGIPHQKHFQKNLSLRGPLMSLRSLVHGVTWKNPVVNVIVHCIDPFDYALRLAKGRAYIPLYSKRVRSNGVRGDIGGGGFVHVGRMITDLLKKHAALTPASNVLEVGCGCGRNGQGLAEFLQDGNYTGMDIEKVALDAGKSNKRLAGKRFKFDFLDVRNDTYNPDGKFPATDYVFPYADGVFDVIFLSSVFTHMLTDEIRNYAKEFHRILKPGGRVWTTAYLLDRPMTHLQFPFHSQEHWYANEHIPGIAVAYKSGFLSSTFKQAGFSRKAGPLWGDVHGTSETGLDQDLMVFQRD